MLNQEQVLDSDITGQMTDTGGGVFTYSTTIARPGDVTVNVYKYFQGGAYTEYFNNFNYQLPIAFTNVSTDINYDWSTGIIFNSVYDGSAKFYFKLYAPVTDTYYFYLSHDDGGELLIDNVSVLNVV